MRHNSDINRAKNNFVILLKLLTQSSGSERQLILTFVIYLSSGSERQLSLTFVIYFKTLIFRRIYL